MTYFKSVILILLVGWTLFQVTTCATTECSSEEQVIKIQKVKETSSKLNKSTIKVEGVVTASLSLPTFKIYQIQDNRGSSIWVKLTYDNYMPYMGTSLQICAEVKEMFNINGAVKAVILVELGREELEEQEEFLEEDTGKEYHVFTYDHPD